MSRLLSLNRKLLLSSPHLFFLFTGWVNMFCLWCVEPKTSPKEDILDQSEPMTKSAMESSNQTSKNVSLQLCWLQRTIWCCHEVLNFKMQHTFRKVHKWSFGFNPIVACWVDAGVNYAALHAVSPSFCCSLATVFLGWSIFFPL